MKTDENKMKENGVKTAGHKMDSCCCGHGHDQPKNEAQKEGKYYCLMKCEGSKIYDQPGNCPINLILFLLIFNLKTMKISMIMLFLALVG